jgi:hypothetical protein
MVSPLPLRKLQIKAVLFPDLSKGVARINATYQVSCTECGNRAGYDEDDLERYQHPESAKPVLPHSN